MVFQQLYTGIPNLLSVKILFLYQQAPDDSLLHFAKVNCESEF